MLTAAHCVSVDGSIERIQDISVYLGFGSYTNFVHNVTVEAKDQHMHPEFLSTPFGFDIGMVMKIPTPSQFGNFCIFFFLYYSICYVRIALIRLPESVQLGPNIQIAKLPTNCFSGPEDGNESVIVVGTGRFTIDTVPDRVLRYAMSQTISREECAWLFQSNIFRSIDQSNLICTKVLEGRSSYKGDSGTPHQQKNDFFM